MKTNKNTNKTMTAFQFMKEFENTQLIMESIADATAVERKALLESGFGGPSADTNGLFDMNSLLDVEVSDKPENQPRYYNSPVDPLNDSDKALIVDAFAKKLEEMKDDVIDFSDIGPIATVIKNSYGFKQDIEKFLQDTIQKTSNWMTQQNNTEANTNGVAEMKDGGPTDIKPQTSGIDGGDMGMGGGDMGMGDDMGMGGEGIPAMEEVPVLTDTDAVAEDIVPPELGGDVGMGDEGMDLGLGEDVPPVGDEGMDLGLGEDVPPVSDDVGDDVGVPPVGDDVGGDDVGGDDVGEDVPPIEDETPAEEKKEEKKEGDKEEGEEKEDDKETDELLESIMTDYQKSSKAKESVNAINESVEKSKAVKAQLEAISNTYHSKENAKVEAIKQDKMIKAQLESISSNYKATVNAKLEAIEKEKEIDGKLNQLLESHKQKTSTDGKTNLTARLEAKDKIEKLTK